jgi:hypothetical protein
VSQVGFVSGAAQLRGRRLRLIAGLALAAGIATGAGRVAWAADVDITVSTDNGFLLDSFSGATVQVEAGVTVSDTTFNFYCPTPPFGFSAAGLCASTKAWTLTNLGTIGPAPFGTGVMFNAGGAIINSGSISGDNSIVIEGGTGGSVDNKLGATITGEIVIVQHQRHRRHRHQCGNHHQQRSGNRPLGRRHRDQPCHRIDPGPRR